MPKNKNLVARNRNVVDLRAKARQSFIFFNNLSAFILALPLFLQSKNIHDESSIDIRIICLDGVAVFACAYSDPA